MCVGREDPPGRAGRTACPRPAAPPPPARSTGAEAAPPWPRISHSPPCAPRPHQKSQSSTSDSHRWVSCTRKSGSKCPRAVDPFAMRHGTSSAHGTFQVVHTAQAVHKCPGSLTAQRPHCSVELPRYCLSRMFTRYCLSRIFTQFCLSRMFTQYCLFPMFTRYCLSRMLTRYCLSRIFTRHLSACHHTFKPELGGVLAEEEGGWAVQLFGRGQQIESKRRNTPTHGSACAQTTSGKWKGREGRAKDVMGGWVCGDHSSFAAMSLRSHRQGPQGAQTAVKAGG